MCIPSRSNAPSLIYWRTKGAICRTSIDSFMLYLSIALVKCIITETTPLARTMCKDERNCLKKAKLVLKTINCDHWQIAGEWMNRLQSVNLLLHRTVVTVYYEIWWKIWGIGKYVQEWYLNSWHLISWREGWMSVPRNWKLLKPIKTSFYFSLSNDEGWKIPLQPGTDDSVHGMISHIFSKT